MPEIEVFSPPVPKARPRLGRGRVFTPRATELAEDRIREAWLEAGWGRLEGALRLEVTVFLARPDGHANPPRKDGTRTRSAAWRARPEGRPDIDNYAKTASDALNKVAYADDGQVVSLLAEKFYADHTPRWRIGVYPADGMIQELS